MSETVEKPLIVKLHKEQLKELFVLIDHYIAKEITDKLSSIVDKLEKLENAIIKAEGELKLIRMEICDLKEKVKK
ncbi:MAG: hypothetical protein NY202_05910 [Mollicutes bacterium UO1]